MIDIRPDENHVRDEDHRGTEEQQRKNSFQDFIDEQVEMFQDLEDAEVHVVQGDGHRVQDPTQEFDHAVKRAVGDPGRTAFVRVLRLGGALQEAIEYARMWSCPAMMPHALFRFAKI